MQRQGDSVELAPFAGAGQVAPPHRPVVSVVITCFNGKQWIGAAIESALAQSYAEREIIIIDDASTDGSAGLVQRYARHPEVRIIRHRRNLGIPATKNAGWRAATGRHVAFLEQDDEWLENKIERQVEALEKDPRLGMVFATAIYVDDRGRERLRRRRTAVPDTTQGAVEALFLGNPVTSMSSVMFRRAALEALGGFDESYHGGDDYDLFLRLAGAFGMALVDEPLLRYRWHHDSFSWKRADSMLADHLRMLDRAADRYPYLRPLKRKRAARVRLSHAVGMFEAGATSRGLRCAWETRNQGYLSALPAMALMLTGPPGRWAIRRWRWATRFRRLSPRALSFASKPATADDRPE
jgi:glycosyltransferase involved in cell wall biosynthesis